jgi:hypothetical protein
MLIRVGVEAEAGGLDVEMFVTLVVAHVKVAFGGGQMHRVAQSLSHGHIEHRQRRASAGVFVAQQAVEKDITGIGKERIVRLPFTAQLWPV